MWEVTHYVEHWLHVLCNTQTHLPRNDTDAYVVEYSSWKEGKLEVEKGSLQVKHEENNNNNNIIISNLCKCEYKCGVS